MSAGVRWLSPVPLVLQETQSGESFLSMPAGATGLPLAPHPGSFGFKRTHHTHEGVDLYCEEGTPVSAVEDGRVVSVLPFTGEIAGLPWWLDTYVVLVEGLSGVVAYGEIHPTVEVGASLTAGDVLGHVQRVLRNDKGRPMSMLHLELHETGTRTCPEWTEALGRPFSLRDPTPLLRQASAWAPSAT